MPRLKPVPDAPLRALGLIRVSKERDVMISPDVQRTSISDHAARRGYVVTEWREGIDESGSRARSAWWPRLNEAVELVEAGQVDVILVWKYSRTARHRLRWAVALDRVETAGGVIESATEQIDTTTSTGRFTRGMLAEMSAFEAERIGDTWKEAHAHRTARGLPANGKPRFGYAYVDGMHRPDPDTGAVLAALYRRYVGGESVYALVEWLNREGYRTAAGYSRNGPGPWSQVTLRRALDTGFGAGFITVAGERVRGAHEPVIDGNTWQAYLSARAARRTLRRSERSQYLLSGMVRCMHVLPDGTLCGSSMGGGQFVTQRQAKFRCLAAAAERRHPGGYVTMSVAEDAVLEWVQGIAAEVDNEAVKAQTRSPARPPARRDIDAIARELTALERDLTTASRQVIRGVLPESEYAKVRAEIEVEKRALADRHARALRAADQAEIGQFAVELAQDWDGGLLLEQKRDILRRMLGDGGRVEVTPGRPRSDIRVAPAWADREG